MEILNESFVLSLQWGPAFYNMHERNLRKNMHISLNWRSKREWIQIWLLHVQQTDLCIHCFEFVILVRVCIKLGDF